MSNNSETVRDTRNVSKNHDYETGVVLSDSVNKTCVKRPIAEISRWRHIRLAIKPRFLGNHASQIQIYYRTLSGSGGRTFRIRHEKFSEALPSGEITMTSYPIGNKTSLSRKLCIPDKKLLRNAIRGHGRSFRNRHKKSPEVPPSEEITMTSYPPCKETPLFQKPCIPDENLQWDAIRKWWSLFQKPSRKISWSAL